MNMSNLTKTMESFVFSNPWTKKIAAFFGAACGLLLCRSVLLSAHAKLFNLPPPFVGVPYFGSFFTIAFLKQNFSLKFLPKKGPICSYHIGNQTFIALNDAKLVQAIFKHACSVNRPSNLRTEQSANHLAFANMNENWVDRRKFAFNALVRVANNDFMDKQVRYLCKKFIFANIDRIINNCNSDRKLKAKWYCKNDMDNCAFNMIFGSLFGVKEQLVKHDEKYKSYVDLLSTQAKIFSFIFLCKVLSIPILSDILQKNYEKLEIKQHEIVSEYVDKAIASFDSDDKNNNDIDVKTVIDEMYKEINSDASKYTFYLDDTGDNYSGNYTGNNKEDKSKLKLNKTFVADVFVLIGAGTETTSLGLETAIFYLAKYPKIQENIYNELITFVPAINTTNKTSNSPNSNDDEKHFIALKNIAKCVLLRAFVHESLRITTPVTRGIPRQLTEPCQITFDS